MDKSFDCVKMVREIRDKHYEETKDMSQEEKIEYIKRQAKNLEPKIRMKMKG
jgi:hypothetical protein